MSSLLLFTHSASGDVVLWLRRRAPDSRRAAAFRRQARYGANCWTIFDGGTAQFFLSVLTGVVNPLSERSAGTGSHLFVNRREV
ncbi:hypothetical protein [Streptomyces incanus]|uniref:Uncharacterized protein n=1 Tax=Streptomyces incanus TaxID=887453 RepID=A0ABW0XPN3_9ACTN